ncbi:D-alanyl-D-alanine dipeptidase [Hymenobacter luteus]|uniref:D-alanyl-D-alanine dipeptidase n=2 Tax=Hymenobacter TaxID=89966 RepID=A0A7W9SXT2_9BACT|nr:MULTISPECIES: M15 family metallopeptidase [Hymenobacter]MBB4600481.1 D-alanyl-D-alanine dipeptidase [Hymenobacter latericoloratus]MBB6057209.1 D-alanyl-D-alanine dipeptidase [Hymenobacter luteus]
MAANEFGLPLVSSPEHYQQRIAQSQEQELVDLRELIPDLVLDIRYATSRNLLGVALYPTAGAYLRRPVAEALARVQTVLAQRGLGLCVYDAYRPYSVSVRLYEQLQDENVAAPPWRGSRHNRGCSVDVGLVEQATGRHVPLPTDFDELTPAAHIRFENLPNHILLNRTVLLAAMQAQGFVNYPNEWWHFDHYRWAEFDLLDLPFAALR